MKTISDKEIEEYANKYIKEDDEHNDKFEIDEYYVYSRLGVKQAIINAINWYKNKIK